MVGPKYVRPQVPLAGSWSAQGDARLAAQSIDRAWWHAFQDPVLDRLIELAYHQNLPLQVAGLRILEARAQLGIAVGEQYPQLQAAVANATAVGLSEHAANNAKIDRTFGDYQVGFDAVWELDFWGKYARGVKAATAGYLATVADYDDGLVSLSAEVARTYAVIRMFEVLIELARSNAKYQEEGLHLAESRFQNGATTGLDVAQAATLLETTRASIPQLQISWQQAENALCTLLGQTTGSVQTLLVGARGIPAVPAQVAVSVPAEMLRRRPDIRSAELNAIAQCDRVGVAKADYYPRFVLVGSIGTQTSSGGGVLSDDSSVTNLFGAGSLFYSIGPRIFWPILNYGRITNNVRVQDARLQQSLVNYQNTVLKAAQEVEDGLTGFLHAQEAAAFDQKASTAAEQAVQLAIVQYREGAVDYQRVVDAQRSLLQVQNELARTRSSVATYLIALYKALGGGWEMRQGQTVIPEGTQIEMQKRTNWGDYLSKPPPEQAKQSPPPTPNLQVVNRGQVPH
jgi:NodT family efflux transporter outer membrane factor (OMF) lipoprotein